METEIWRRKKEKKENKNSTFLSSFLHHTSVAMKHFNQNATSSPPIQLHFLQWSHADWTESAFPVSAKVPLQQLLKATSLRITFV